MPPSSQETSGEIDVPSKMVMWVVTGGLVAIAGIGAVRTAINIVRRNRSKSWAIAPGRITASTMTEQEVSSTYQDSTIYHARIAYAYTVNGASHTGTRIEWIDAVGADSKDAARKILDKYPVGQAVNVYFDAADPKSAILEPWRMRGILFGVAVTVGATLGAIFVGWDTYHRL